VPASGAEENIRVALRARRDELLRQMRPLSEELGRVEAALHNLDPDERGATTIHVARQFIRSVPPGTEFLVGRVVGYAVEQGWQTTARGLTNAMAGVLARLVNQGEITRPRRAVYKTPEKPDAP
jgi:hypothetical protein